MCLFICVLVCRWLPAFGYLRTDTHARCGNQIYRLGIFDLVLRPQTHVKRCQSDPDRIGMLGIYGRKRT